MTEEKKDNNTPQDQKEESDNDQIVKTNENDHEKLDEEKEYKDKYIRLFADFENYKKRNRKERYELIENSNQLLILKLLPILDDFERALESKSTDTTSDNSQGFNLIHKKLKEILEKEGLEEITLKKGDEFNPEISESLTKIESESNLKDKIYDVVEKGYKVNNKVLRVAKVIIGA